TSGQHIPLRPSPPRKPLSHQWPHGLSRSHLQRLVPLRLPKVHCTMRREFTTHPDTEPPLPHGTVRSDAISPIGERARSTRSSGPRWVRTASTIVGGPPASSCKTRRPSLALSAR